MLNAFKAWLTGAAGPQFHRTSRKTISVAVFLVIAALFGDTLLLLLKKFLHVLVEIFESVMEHFLQSVFPISPRQAEMIVFWLDLLMASVLLWYLLNKAYGWTRRACAECLRQWRRKQTSEKWLTLFWAAVILGALLKIGLLLFS
ncbi:hypothetical protein [Candidatus Methylomicrobium oryzae]|uniref:hypothetical protein n=1 Tax=Candidatus Methylomicrobium oryzae TaxID=2802053 RepID=UPI001920C7B0|nr:hypothetical protein [Methylomicrobium sp. RS1]MBL1262451.1 hypothetical protein [Methylomicrobium sp. RS1]